MLVRSALSTVDYGRHELVVRINALDTPYWQADLEAILPQKPAMILLPKADGSASIQTLDTAMRALEQQHGLAEGTVKIGALIETAIGVERAFEIAAASSRVDALFLGAEDLTADTHSTRSLQGEEIFYARGRLVNAARAGNVEVYDTPFTDVNDLDALASDAALARQMGFSGKLVISPRHLETVNRIFSPSDAEIQYAKDVFTALEEGKRLGRGAVALRGKMIDAPVVKRATRILQMVAETEDCLCQN